MAERDTQKTKQNKNRHPEPKTFCRSHTRKAASRDEGVARLGRWHRVWYCVCTRCLHGPHILEELREPALRGRVVVDLFGEARVAEKIRETLSQRLACASIFRQPEVAADDVLEQPAGATATCEIRNNRCDGQWVSSGEGGRIANRSCETRTHGYDESHLNDGWSCSCVIMFPRTAPTAKNLSAVWQT